MPGVARFRANVYMQQGCVAGAFRVVPYQIIPLENLGMPPMTMAFGVADKAWLNKLKPGDKIRFAAEMKGGNAIVSRYEMAK